MDKVLERWHGEGITDEAQAAETLGGGKPKKKPARDTSFDLDEYEKMLRTYTPVYKKE